MVCDDREWRCRWCGLRSSSPSSWRPAASSSWPGCPSSATRSPSSAPSRPSDPRSSSPSARLFALLEVAVGLAAVAAPVSSAAGVALLYAGFTAFVLVALARGGVVESCGCLGRADTPPTVAHAATTATFALAAALAAFAAPPGTQWWARGPAAALAVAALAGLLAFVAWVVLAVLPLVTPAAVRSTGRA